MSGTVGILNVGAGDTKLTFDKNNPAERIRAARIVKDMLRRGYALLIEVQVGKKKETRRALDFDENTCEYIIADFDPITAADADAQESEHGKENEASPFETHGQPPAKPLGPPPVKAKRGRPSKRIAADATTGVAVARTAGG